MATNGGDDVVGMWRLLRATMGDARRADELMCDPIARRALRADPEAALLGFELRARSIGDDAGARRARGESRERGVRAVRGRAVLG